MEVFKARFEKPGLVEMSLPMTVGFGLGDL